MNEVKVATEKFIDYLDSSEIVNDFIFYKEKLLDDNIILAKINKYQNNLDDLELKKEIFSDENYANYMKHYNKLFYMVMDINKRISNITESRGCNEGNKW